MADKPVLHVAIVGNTQNNGTLLERFLPRLAKATQQPYDLKVELFKTADEALGRLPAYDAAGQCDLVITDRNLVEGTAEMFLAELRKQGVNAPAIITTGNAGLEDTIDAAQRAGAVLMQRDEMTTPKLFDVIRDIPQLKEKTGEPAEKPTLLLVEDDATQLFIMQELLSGHYRVIGVNNATDALEALKNEHPMVMLTDYGLKKKGTEETEKSGIALIEQARKLNPELAVIMYSGSEEVHRDMADAHLGSSVAFLKKGGEEDLSTAIPKKIYQALLIAPSMKKFADHTTLPANIISYASMTPEERATRDLEQFRS